MMLNKMSMKVFNHLYKKLDTYWNTYNLGESVRQKKVNYHLFSKEEDIQYCIDSMSIIHIKHKNIYAVELSFYHTHHDEQGSHNNLHFIEYVSDWSTDDIDKIATEAISRWTDKYDILIDRWKIIYENN